jgi:hypothetical protein
MANPPSEGMSLYQVQHLAPYLGRLQTIPNPDIEEIYPWSTVRDGTTISQVRGPTSDPVRPARQTWALVGPPNLVTERLD